MAELLLVEQRAGSGGDDGAHWILEGGRILPGVDDNRRMEELRRGLLSQAGVPSTLTPTAKRSSRRSASCTSPTTWKRSPRSLPSRW